MAPLKIQNTWEQISHRGKQSFDKLNEWSHGWLRVIINSGNEIFKTEASNIAASIAYYSLFSLFPIVLLSVAIASFGFGGVINVKFILTRLEFIAPALVQLLGPNIDQIIQSRSTVSIVALVGIIWSGSNIFNVLNQILNDIWSFGRNRPIWKTRGLAILFVLAFAGPVLVLMSFAGSMAANLRNLLPTQFIPLVDSAGLVVTILLDVTLFVLLYAVFPHGKATLKDILIGAIGGGFLWELAKKAFVAFVSFYLSSSNLIYGSVATIIAFLTWAYLSGHIFLFGAYLCKNAFQLRQQSTVPRP